MLSEVRSLGGMTYNATAESAKSHSGIPPVTPASPRVRDSPPQGLLSTQGEQPSSVFSRSAPAANGGNHERDQIHGHDRVHLRGAATIGDATPSSDVEDERDRNTIAYVEVLDPRRLINKLFSRIPGLSQIFSLPSIRSSASS